MIFLDKPDRLTFQYFIVYSFKYAGSTGAAIIERMTLNGRKHDTVMLFHKNTEKTSDFLARVSVFQEVQKDFTIISGEDFKFNT